MRARVGDHIVVAGTADGRFERSCVVLRVIEPDGRPPYLVRWMEDDRVGQFYPGADAFVDHCREAS